MNYIYTVTCIEFGNMYSNKRRSVDGIFRSYKKRTSPNQEEYFTIIDKRTWGWYSKIKDAKRCVETNSCDIYEGTYNTAVIEKVPEGSIVNIPTREWWYKWKGSWKKGGYKPTEKPKSYNDVVVFWG